MASAADQKKSVQKLDIRLAKKGWGEARPETARRLLQWTAKELWQFFPDRKMSPIVVEPKGGPIVLFKRGSKGEYFVKLNTGGLYWSQYAYQFSHEFCHILCNYDPDKHGHDWFEESLCELASMFAMRRMGETWKTDPPFGHWKNYAPSLTKYANDVIAKGQLPKGKTLAQWYQENKKKLLFNATHRNLNRFVAVELLPLFEKDPSRWEAVTWLNHGKPAGPQAFDDYLADWRKAAPAKHRPFIDSIAAKFEIKLTTQTKGKTTNWRGLERTDFQVDGRVCYVVRPKEPAQGNPWVWRARFPGYHPEIDVELLKRGFHIAYMNTNGMLGSPAALKHWDVFYEHMTKRHNLSKRPALEAVSRGGLFAYRWAARHPERVACIYADVPVCDLKSWPGGHGKGIGHKGTWLNALKHYKMTEKVALKFDKNPIDVLAPIAKANVPLMHIVTENDRVVPPKENTYIVKERYEKLGGRMTVTSVKEGTAKSNGHHFTLTPKHIESAVSFFVKHAGSK